MTRRSIKEYAGAIQERYRRGTKKEKGKILDEFTKATGLHRKAVIRLLNSHRQTSDKRKVRRGWTPSEVRTGGRRGAQSCLGGIGPSLFEAVAPISAGTHARDTEMRRKQNDN